MALAGLLGAQSLPKHRIWQTARVVRSTPRSQLLALPHHALDCHQTGVISDGQGQPVYYELTDIATAFRLDGRIFRKGIFSMFDPREKIALFIDGANLYAT